MSIRKMIREHIREQFETQLADSSKVIDFVGILYYDSENVMEYTWRDDREIKYSDEKAESDIKKMQRNIVLFLKKNGVDAKYDSSDMAIYGEGGARDWYYLSYDSNNDFLEYDKDGCIYLQDVQELYRGLSYAGKRIFTPIICKMAEE